MESTGSPPTAGRVPLGQQIYHGEIQPHEVDPIAIDPSSFDVVDDHGTMLAEPPGVDPASGDPGRGL